jgi:hypothetical protein
MKYIAFSDNKIQSDSGPLTNSVRVQLNIAFFQIQKQRKVLTTRILWLQFLH